MNEVTRTQKVYNALAALWSKGSTNSFFHEKEFRIFESKLKKGDRVADIGCANGIHVPLFLGIGSKLKYEGFDFSKSMLKIATSRYPNIKFNYLNVVDQKTFPKKKYDAFWASAVLMHVPFTEWDNMFANIESIMKPKSYGYITIPEQKPIAKSNRDQRHFTLMSQKNFSSYIKKRGWKVLRTGPTIGANDIRWNWFIVQIS